MLDYERRITELQATIDIQRAMIIEWKSMYCEQKDIAIKFRELWHNEKLKEEL